MINKDISGITQSPEELADLIDSLMEGGTGHINVFMKQDGCGLSVETVNSTDCGITGACAQPTEDEPISDIKSIFGED